MIPSRRTYLLASAALGVSIGVGCQKKNEYVAPPPPTVEVSRPVEQSVTDYVEFTGTTRAVAQVELRARVNGYLEKIHFEEGATVAQGQLLFTIEQAPFEVKLRIANAELDKAKAQLDLADAELRRQRTLLSRNAGTVAEFEVQQATREAAAATVASAEASLTESQLQRNYTEVRAPIGGRIGRHLVDEGNLVQAEQTLLALIESYDPIHAYFTISEGDLLDLRRERGGSAFGGGQAEIEMGLGGEEAYPHKGKLDFSDLGVDPSTGTLQLRGIFPNADRSILPGLFARVRTTVGSPTPQWLVPERALGTDQQGDYVLVVDEKGKVEYRQVSLGRLVEGMRVVIKGLKGDEWIVVNGLQRARPGSQVVPDREGSSTTPVASEASGPDAEAEPEGPNVASQAEPTRSG